MRQVISLFNPVPWGSAMIARVLILACVAGCASLGSSRESVPPGEKGLPDRGPRFEVASVRQNLNPEPRWKLVFTDDGLHAMDVTLYYAMQDAYGVYDDALWQTVPAWTKEKRFDIEAKYDVEKYTHPTRKEQQAMFQALLEERFGLEVHHEAKEFPLYALVFAKSGMKLVESKPGDPKSTGPRGPICLNTGTRVRGHLEMYGCPISAFTMRIKTLAQLGRMVVDQTGLEGRYDFKLDWTPDNAPVSDEPVAAPAFFTALEEQLGLQLKPTKGSLDTITVDHVEMSTEN